MNGYVFDKIRAISYVIKCMSSFFHYSLRLKSYGKLSYIESGFNLVGGGIFLLEVEPISRKIQRCGV